MTIDEELLKKVFKNGYNTSNYEDRRTQQLIISRFESFLGRELEKATDVEDIKTIQRCIKGTRQAGEVYRAGMQAKLLSNGQTSLDEEWKKCKQSLMLQTDKDDVQENGESGKKFTPLSKQEVMNKLGFKPSNSRAEWEKQQEEIRQREIRRAKSGTYQMSDRTKAIIGISAFIATMIATNLFMMRLGVNSETMTKFMESKNHEKPTAAETFRNSMRITGNNAQIGENNISYNYNNNTIQIEDKGR